MRSLILAVLVLSGCAEGVAPPRQRDNTENAIPEETGKEKTTSLVQAPEVQAEQQEEQEEETTATPAKPFSYDEWTAELPTLGRPKVPGPPFLYLEAGGKKEIFDRLRQLRWVAWAYERVVLLEEAWVINWQEWIEDGHGVRVAARADAARLCVKGGQPYPLRTDDQSLKEIIPRYGAARSEWGELAQSYDGGFRVELSKMERLIFAYGSGTEEAWLSKLSSLLDSLVERRERTLGVRPGVADGVAKIIAEKIHKAHGCSRDDPFNACWVPNLSISYYILYSSRYRQSCKDQR